MKLLKLASLLAVTALLTACISHYFVDGDVRLQIGNSTERYTLERFSVIDSLGSELVWIEEEILPGEKSKVHTGYYVGTFRVKLVYELEGSEADTVFRKNFDGGSTFMKVSESDSGLVFKLK